MYRSCLFCNTNLGQNEIIDRFPVGERLAFDPAKGRLGRVPTLSPVEPDASGRTLGGDRRLRAPVS